MAQLKAQSQEIQELKEQWVQHQKEWTAVQKAMLETQKDLIQMMQGYKKEQEEQRGVNERFMAMLNEMMGRMGLPIEGDKKRKTMAGPIQSQMLPQGGSQSPSLPSQGFSQPLSIPSGSHALTPNSNIPSQGYSQDMSIPSGTPTQSQFTDFQSQGFSQQLSIPAGTQGSQILSPYTQGYILTSGGNSQIVASQEHYESQCSVVPATQFPQSQYTTPDVELINTQSQSMDSQQSQT
ncbi:hypothetical protein FBU30_002672, partial [Linnemannia zychae]